MCADFGRQEHAGEKQFPLFFPAFVVSGSLVLSISSILEKFCLVLSHICNLKVD